MCFGPHGLDCIRTETTTSLLWQPRPALRLEDAHSLIIFSVVAVNFMETVWQRGAAGFLGAARLSIRPRGAAAAVRQRGRLGDPLPFLLSTGHRCVPRVEERGGA